MPRSLKEVCHWKKLITIVMKTCSWVWCLRHSYINMRLELGPVGRPKHSRTGLNHSWVTSGQWEADMGALMTNQRPVLAECLCQFEWLSVVKCFILDLIGPSRQAGPGPSCSGLVLSRGGGEDTTESDIHILQHTSYWPGLARGPVSDAIIKFISSFCVGITAPSFINSM